MAEFELPEGWIQLEIGDISEVIAGGTPNASDLSNFAEPGSAIAWITPADLSGYKQPFIAHGSRDLSQKGYESSSAKLLPAGTLLFSSRAPIGYVAIAANPISTNQGFKNFVISQHISSKYVYHFLKSIRDLAESRGTGTTFKELSGANAKKLPFILIPLAEQHEIAARLDTLLAQVDATKARLDGIPALLKRFRQSVLAAAVSGKLTEEWRENSNFNQSKESFLTIILTKRNEEWLKDAEKCSKKRKYTEPYIGTDTDLPVLPHSWQWLSVDSISYKVVDGVHKKPEYYPEGIPFVTVKNLTAGPGISFEKINYISLKDHEEYIRRANPENGDILISKDGTLGVIRRVNTNIEFSIFVSVALVKPVLKEMTRYLELAFKSTIVQSQMVGVGSGLQHIHLGDLKQDMLPIPPLEEQTQIVARVEALFAFADQIEARVKAAQAQVNMLTQAILAKAFRGELTAAWRAQHPELISGENSAEALLARIQAERGQSEKPAKKGGKKAGQARKPKSAAAAELVADDLPAGQLNLPGLLLPEAVEAGR